MVVVMVITFARNHHSRGSMHIALVLVPSAVEAVTIAITDKEACMISSRKDKETTFHSKGDCSKTSPEYHCPQEDGNRFYFASCDEIVRQTLGMM